MPKVTQAERKVWTDAYNLYVSIRQTETAITESTEAFFEDLSEQVRKMYCEHGKSALSATLLNAVYECAEQIWRERKNETA